MAMLVALKSELNSLKRKLTDSEKASKEAHDELNKEKDKVKKVCECSEYFMHKVHKKLKEGEQTGLSLSPEEVQELMHDLFLAQNGMVVLQRPAPAPSSSSIEWVE